MYWDAIFTIYIVIHASNKNLINRKLEVVKLCIIDIFKQLDK